MAQRLSVFVFIAGLLFSCTSEAQSWGEGVKGEGEIVKQEITLDALKGIDLAVSGDVILTPGRTQKIVLEGQKNILDLVSHKVDNGNWEISFTKSVRECKGIKVYITVPEVETLGLTGSGSIQSTAKFSGLDQLELYVSGSGDIEFEYDAHETELDLSGSGEITLKGASQSLEVTISGSGDVSAEKLITDNCEINISGSGNASVHANKKLESNISGSGDVSYSGSASVDSNISGSGDISKIR